MVEKDISIWRAKFNTGVVQSGKMKQSKVFEFCREKKIVGLGWAIPGYPKTIDEAIIQGSKIYKDNGFKTNMKNLKNLEKDDLVWALGEHSYYIGRILDDKYGHLSNEFDVCNTRNCEYHKVGEIENIPGKVVSSFFGSGLTLRHIGDNKERTIENISKLIFNKVSKEEYYKVNLKKDFWLLFSDQEIEEIIGLYLQFEKNYKVYITSKKKATKKYEFTMVNEKNERAAVQVKSGNTPLNYKDYLNDKYKIFLFSACGEYGGVPNTDKIEIIEKRDIEDFILKRKNILPDNIRYWIEL